jgi:predicted membrane-bound mannosyltransferase
MLLYWRSADGPVWSEGFIILLAAFGATASRTGKPADHANSRLGRFLVFYTLIMTAIYAAIPYKTPWCLLGFLSGMILLAGIGAAAIWNASGNISLRIIVAAMLTIGSIHLAWQAYLANYRFFADPRNPYVYAHTTTDIFKIADTINDIARATGKGENLHIEVICPGNDYWPLPWYLRDFVNAGFYEEVDFSTPAAPVIIVSPAAEERLIKKLYELPPPGERELYVPLFDSDVQLRPNVPLNGYVRKSVWDKLQQAD